MNQAQRVEPASDGGVVFAEKLLALLDGGRYTATYKFATLIALVDTCVESVSASGLPPTEVSARDVGRRVLELFWRQAIPYEANRDTFRYLRHSSLHADLVTMIGAFRRNHDLAPGVSVQRARQLVPVPFAELEDLVVTTVIRMPLPKLQRFPAGPGVQEDRFLYDYRWPDEVPTTRVHRADFDDTLYLVPGVGEWLVRLSGMLRPIIQQRWAAFVADRSRDVVETSWLDEFLFGEDRTSLRAVAGPLLEHQEHACFYCGDRATPAGTEVDHFIPWARHPDNGLDNLVAAHRACNNSKRDSLAAEEHLGRWLERLDPASPSGAQLAAARVEVSWPSRPAQTLGSARAAYLWLPQGSLLWASRTEYRPADPAWVHALFVDTAAIVTPG